MSTKEFKVEVEEGVLADPERILVYGMPGIGKTTFAANAPRPFFIDAERGSTRLPVARPKERIEDWETVLGIVQWLTVASHPYETCVIDTLDRVEWLCWQHLCRTGGKNRTQVGSIEDVGGGYAKGYTAAYEEFRRLFGALETLWTKKRMRIVMIAHQKLETVKNPSGADYQRHSLKLHEKVTGMFWEVCDVAMFAAQKIIVTKEVHDEKRYRAIASGDERVLHTVGAPGHVAKNRFGLPPQIPLAWDEFAAAVARGHDPSLLVATIRTKITRLNKPDVGRKVEEAVEGARGAVQRLIQINARMDALLAEERAKREADLSDGAGDATPDALAGGN